MYMNLRTINPVSLSVALAFSALPLAAQANTITLSATASYTLDGGATVNFSDVKSTTGSPAPLSVPGFVDVLDFTNNPSGSSSGIHTYGDTGGSFGSRTDGAGIYDVNGRFVQDRTVVNNTGAALNFFYTFVITDGQINASSTSLMAGQFANANFAVNILANGVSLFQTNALVLTDNTGQSLSSGGTSIFNLGSSCLSETACGASWGSQSFTLNLGILAAGASLDLTYDLTTRAWGNAASAPTTQTYEPFVFVDNNGNTVNDCSGNRGDGGYGGYAAVTITGSGSGGTFNPATGLCERTVSNPVGNSVARFGDPDALFGQPIGNFPITTATVPEPGLLALFGIGLTGIGLMRRRRNKSSS